MSHKGEDRPPTVPPWPPSCCHYGSDQQSSIGQLHAWPHYAALQPRPRNVPLCCLVGQQIQLVFIFLFYWQWISAFQALCRLGESCFPSSGVLTCACEPKPISCPFLTSGFKRRGEDHCRCCLKHTQDNTEPGHLPVFNCSSTKKKHAHRTQRKVAI